MAKIGAYLVEPEDLVASQLPGAIAIVPVGKVAGDLLNAVNFPAFVAGLINGVFQAIVDSSIQQMDAYSELLGNVAKTVDQFAKENISDQKARDWLAITYPDYLEREAKSGDLQLVTGFDRAQALKRFRLLPLLCPLKKLGPAEIEDVLVPAARRRMAADRQQLLATMVLMGVNR